MGGIVATLLSFAIRMRMLGWVNVDVAVFNNKTSFGVIIHDSDGFVLGDSEGYREEIMSVEWAELDA
ncbi:hypothetical protein Gotri_006772 [Gossypium trilobum]|uniref:Uncharacterized protein n=1 Tax=Gossypium trilobum TaxID=34281 RepID=A0A7J9FQL8_9ROSI|nr:hypothetical protein [Gossypium trilobum]